MDPIMIVLIVLFVIYILKSMAGFFITGMMASVMGLMRAQMKARRTKAANKIMLLTWLAFLIATSRIVVPVVVIIGLARGVHAYYLVSMIAFVIFAVIRGIGVSMGPVCRGCGPGAFRMDPIELLIIFLSAMAY